MLKKFSKCVLVLFIFNALVGFNFNKYNKYVLYKHDVEQTKTNIRLMYNYKSEDWTFEKFGEKDSYMLKNNVRIIMKNEDEIETIIFSALSEKDFTNIMHNIGLQLTPHMVKAIAKDDSREVLKSESLITDDFLLTVLNVYPIGMDNHLIATFTFDRKSAEELFNSTLDVIDKELVQ